MATSNTNNLNAGMRCIKYMLFLINLMFVLTAILLIIVGTTIQSLFGKFFIFIDDSFFTPPVFLIVIGSILLFVALFGCVGAIRESTAMINIYGVLLSIVFILEISAAISAFALKSQVGAVLRFSMDKSIQFYNHSSVVREGVDFMQENLECCGVTDPTDWDGIIQDSSLNNGDIVLPESCCDQFNFIDDGTCETTFKYGCFNRMSFLFSQSIMLITTSAMAVAFVQFLGIICAFMLARTIRRTKSLREARRYQMQQTIVGLTTEKSHYKQPYTALESKDKSIEPVLYVPSSPSVN